MCENNAFSARRLSGLDERHYDTARERYLALPGADRAAPGRVEREGRIKAERPHREDAVGPACRSGCREGGLASSVLPLEPWAQRSLLQRPRGPCDLARAKPSKSECGHRNGHLGDKRSRVARMAPCRWGIDPASCFPSKTDVGNPTRPDPMNQQRSPVRTASRTLARRRSNRRAGCRQATTRQSECRQEFARPITS